VNLIDDNLSNSNVVLQYFWSELGSMWCIFVSCYISFTGILLSAFITIIVFFNVYVL